MEQLAHLATPSAWRDRRESDDSDGTKRRPAPERGNVAHSHGGCPRGRTPTCPADGRATSRVRRSTHMPKRPPAHERRPRTLPLRRNGPHVHELPVRFPRPAAHATHVQQRRLQTLAEARQQQHPTRFATATTPKILDLPEASWINRTAAQTPCPAPSGLTHLDKFRCAGRPTDVATTRSTPTAAIAASSQTSTRTVRSGHFPTARRTRSAAATGCRPVPCVGQDVSDVASGTGPELHPAPRPAPAPEATRSPTTSCPARRRRGRTSSPWPRRRRPDCPAPHQAAVATTFVPPPPEVVISSFVDGPRRSLCGGVARRGSTQPGTFAGLMRCASCHHPHQRAVGCALRLEGRVRSRRSPSRGVIASLVYADATRTRRLHRPVRQRHPLVA